VVIAHIAGVPVEESLRWLLPLGSLGVAGLLAWAGEHTRGTRRRLAIRRRTRVNREGGA